MKSSFANFCHETDAPVKSLAELVIYNREHWVDAVEKGIRQNIHSWKDTIFTRCA